MRNYFHKRYAVLYRNLADGIDEFNTINIFPSIAEARAFIAFQARRSQGEWKIKELEK